MERTGVNDDSCEPLKAFFPVRVSSDIRELKRMAFTLCISTLPSPARIIKRFFEVISGPASGQLSDVRVVPRHGRAAMADDGFDHGQRRRPPNPHRPFPAEIMRTHKII